jgi:hypothetical protein
VVSLTVSRSGSVLGFRGKRGPNGARPRSRPSPPPRPGLLPLARSLRLRPRRPLQWALRWINVLVTRPTANRASRVRGGVDLLLLPRQASLRLPSVVCHGYLPASRGVLVNAGHQGSFWGVAGMKVAAPVACGWAISPSDRSNSPFRSAHYRGRGADHAHHTRRCRPGRGRSGRCTAGRWAGRHGRAAWCLPPQRE